jgi:carbonic anhydrase
MEVGGRKFDLVQFHFHTPSEEQVNGKHYDMVWHLVHKDAAGKLGVVGVLVKQGRPNEVIAAIAANLPKEIGKEHIAKGVHVEASKLLPTAKGYYQFSGSLTTPPCSEGVAWHVMKEPIEASAQQIAEFRTLFGNNARPVQPLNARVVKASK